MKEQTLDCDALSELHVDMQLNGRELMVISNALGLLHESEPLLCDNCDVTLDEIHERIAAALDHLVGHLEEK